MARRITWVVAESLDANAWYLDGKYIGHDDQFSPEKLAVAGEIVVVELERVDIEPGADVVDLFPDTWPPGKDL